MFLLKTFKINLTCFKSFTRKNIRYVTILALILPFYYFSSSHLLSSTEKKKTLFCFILAQPENFFHKTSVVWKTWAKECDDFRFISIIPKLFLDQSIKKPHGSIETNFPFPVLQPANFDKENYQQLTTKIYLTLIELYRSYNDYDWYLKADDDTFVFVDHLRDFIADKNPQQPLKYGYNLKTWQSGGAGFEMQFI
jgi:glycoprotein-N-acetylgalactosamine 3-beta-galactosyltransferase